MKHTGVVTKRLPALADACLDPTTKNFGYIHIEYGWCDPLSISLTSEKGWGKNSVRG
jgi:hypothetical protein